MFANLTEETCTGTGDTLALAGVTIGNIPFSASYADGDLVAYFVEDSGGTIKVAGVGTYVSATDDITRNDTWSWDGTVIDKSPATNITLSSGTHTVRSDAHTDTLAGQSRTPTSSTLSGYGYFGDFVGNSSVDTVAWAVDRCSYEPILVGSSKEVSGLAIKVITADATAPLCMVGLYSTGADGLPNKLLDSVTIDVTTTGTKAASFSSNLDIPPAMYVIAVACSSATPAFEGLQGHQTNATTYAPWGVNTSNSNRHYIPYQVLTSGWTALPAMPSIDFNQIAHRVNVELELV